MKYNITPAFSKAIGVGDVITISGEFKRADDKVNYVEVELEWHTIREFNKNAKKNTAATFSVNITITQENINDIFSGIETGTTQAGLHFTLWSSDGGGDYSEPVAAQEYTVIKTRSAPVISAIALADRKETYSGGTTLLAYFGDYIQSASLPRLTATFATDSRDTKLTTTHHLVVTDSNDNVVADVSGTSPVNTTTKALDIPAITAAGTYSYVWSVTDSARMSATDYTGTFTVLAYSPPSITNWVVERYRTVVGEPDPVPAPDGDHVMLSLTGNVSQVASKNAWTFALRWSENGGAQTTVTIDSGNDGDSLLITRDDTLFTAQVSLSSIYEFTAILTDKVGQTAQTYEVPKATCYLNVEKNGIGIGMYTVGTASDKRVDIADDYTLHANGDAAIGGDASFGGNVAVGSGKLLKVVNVTVASSVSIAGGASGEYEATVNPGTGWTPLCTVGTRCNNGRIIMRRVYLTGTKVHVEPVNTGTSTYTIGISADVLCVRTSL